ncbi:hypothetical protein EJ04DRAFT_30903 [Polyplosphaeria fusca]|uniref:Uncharacterized protein n=1 Tax=Polyplosphaeria fusca TaxID=682080 RepID=A0A9P4QTJ0_9PLEO|nr:hypothetical protein EJ04DRAFT_30903 [Polyplosphaeria fusca]
MSCSIHALDIFPSSLTCHSNNHVSPSLLSTPIYTFSKSFCLLTRHSISLDSLTMPSPPQPRRSEEERPRRPSPPPSGSRSREPESPRLLAKALPSTATLNGLEGLGDEDSSIHRKNGGAGVGASRCVGEGSRNQDGMDGGKGGEGDGGKAGGREGEKEGT